MLRAPPGWRCHVSRTWNLVPLAAVFALTLFLLPNGPAGPRSVAAEDCTAGNTGTLVIQVINLSTGNRLPFAGAEVLVKPDPSDFVLDTIVVDSDAQDANAAYDKDSRAGAIRIEGACSTEGSETYSARVWSLPGDYAECDFDAAFDSTSLAAGETENLTLEVDCAGLEPTPTPAPSATPGAVATVQAFASPLSLNCGGASAVTVHVRDAGGQPVQTGTVVTVATTLGTINPSSLVTGSTGNVHATFTAPADTGGMAVITATSGSVTGTASVAVSCGGTTVAPPPTAGAGSGAIIRPPNTGDAGLAAPATQSGVIASVVLLLAGASVTAAWKVRRS